MHLIDSLNRPLNELIEMFATGKHVSRNMDQLGDAYQSQDRRTFYLNGRSVRISVFCDMTHDTADDADDSLWALRWAEASTRGIFQIEQNTILDDVTFTKTEHLTCESAAQQTHLQFEVIARVSKQGAQSRGKPSS